MGTCGASQLIAVVLISDGLRWVHNSTVHLGQALRLPNVKSRLSQCCSLTPPRPMSVLEELAVKIQPLVDASGH
ncbi:hypothetical protein BO82DRAFT_352221 [Aspergillus uvarum CBS 121591]|uniref:Uncharacterized protein n=1 Tax=Aspergillus uvarum CBS 121591 TaxID=1448315 RepID=A0A319CZN9_9EURO|nr:hypothetical protein BO82DRAFT_352221 [Aspergillus uvarum CBS 121591]PYH84243.1 hypothetical protein BO82DRAFT_352221 [Aspergillus uvarum CBS 121591]